MYNRCEKIIYEQFFSSTIRSLHQLNGRQSPFKRNSPPCQWVSFFSPFSMNYFVKSYHWPCFGWEANERKTFFLALTTNFQNMSWLQDGKKSAGPSSSKFCDCHKRSSFCSLSMALWQCPLAVFQQRGQPLLEFVKYVAPAKGVSDNEGSVAAILSQFTRNSRPLPMQPPFWVEFGNIFYPFLWNVTRAEFWGVPSVEDNFIFTRRLSVTEFSAKANADCQHFFFWKQFSIFTFDFFVYPKNGSFSEWKLFLLAFQVTRMQERSS